VEGRQEDGTNSHTTRGVDATLGKTRRKGATGALKQPPLHKRVFPGGVIGRGTRGGRRTWVSQNSGHLSALRAISPSRGRKILSLWWAFLTPQRSRASPRCAARAWRRKQSLSLFCNLSAWRFALQPVWARRGTCAPPCALNRKGRAVRQEGRRGNSGSHLPSTLRNQAVPHSSP